MKKFVMNKGITSEASSEQRNLLSVAYKNVVGSRRSAWRVVSSIMEKDNSDKENKDIVNMRTTYKKEIETELKEICDEVIVSQLFPPPPPKIKYKCMCITNTISRQPCLFGGSGGRERGLACL